MGDEMNDINLSRLITISVSRIKWLWSWLGEARFAWLALGVITVALDVCLQPHASESTIRLTGLVLQLLGIFTVIWGISETRALFGHPSVMFKAKSWLGRCPLLRRNLVAAAGFASISLDTCKARAHITHRAGPNPTTESRLDALEKNISLLHDRISGTEKEMDEELRKTTVALKNEEQIRKAEDNFILDKLEATGTGGVHISAIGASWLFIGVILSTAGIEIEMWLK